MQQLKLNERKRILITGAAKHLGAELAVSLAKCGYDLVIHYKTSELKAHEVATACGGFGVQVDIIQGDFDESSGLEDFIRRYTQAFDHTYALINNVGSYLTKPTLETTYHEWQRIFHNNLHAPFYLTTSLFPQLKKQKGAIINIGVAGLNRQQANSYASAYAIAKSALLLLTKSVAKELASDSVRCNMISPGHLPNSVDLKNPQELPMHREAQYEEVVKLALFLLGNDAQYITGQNIEVAGGYAL